MYIAVCDDDKNDLNIVLSLLHQYDHSKRLKIDSFFSAKALLEKCQIKNYDIAILDIEMESPNGYEAAEKLVAQPAPPLIIFVTNSLEYTIRGYGVAFRYLPKPIDLLSLSKAMDSAIREITSNRFLFFLEGTSCVLRIEEIYYIESFGHQIVLHTQSNDFSMRSTLINIISQLPQGRFGFPHQSYIVNLQHIRTASQKEIHLTNGKIIPISRRKQQEFERQFHQYLGR